ncbi:MAG: recombinase family protein, partial [Cyanobacteria bacterium]|nr:recombinase family protein [Cyanobacteriota bacterium]
MSAQKTNNAKSGSSGTVRKLVAISYSRVSTGKQAEQDRSGEERQELEIAKWIRENPEYELDRAVKDVVSGAKSGRFEWFINELEQGRL